MIVQPHSVFSIIFLEKERRGTATANFPKAKGVLTYVCYYNVFVMVPLCLFDTSHCIFDMLLI